MNNKPSRSVPFFFGLILGILGMIFLPSYVRPYLPEWIMGKTIVVTGTVTAKQKKADSLLLTVNTPEGALLATFNKKVDEISLLVDQNDKIEFTLPKYAPIIDDPKIIRITKEPPAAPEPEPVEKPVEKSAKVIRPQRKEKPQAAVAVAPTPTTAPAPQSRVSTTEVKPLDNK
jgi:outer membrane biosynthesis protein TonB